MSTSRPAGPSPRRGRLARPGTRFRPGAGVARPSSPLTWLLVALVAYLTAAPLLLLVWGSLRAVPPGVAGPLTLIKWVQAFSGSQTLTRAGVHTVVFAFGGSLVAFVIGTMFAWLVERTDFPFKVGVFVLMIAPHVLPGVLKAYAWLLLLSPRIGILDAAAGALFHGAKNLFDVYSMGGMIWVFGIDSITLPFLMMVAAFRSMDGQLDDAARLSGAGRLSTFRKITLPLALPAVLGTWILVFMHGMEDFEVPALIGIPAKIDVFSTEIWARSTAVPADMNLASVYSVVYMLASLLVLVAYLRAVRGSDRFATITGKGFRPATVRLGALRWAVAGPCWLGLAAVVGLPFLAILWTSIIPYYQAPNAAVLHHLSMGAYAATLVEPQTYTTLRNTSVVAFAATTLLVALAALVSWVVVRGRAWVGRVLEVLTFTPIAVSGTLFGLALIWFYLTAPIPLYDTLGILIVGFIAKFMPEGMRFSTASLVRVARELEEAGLISGARWRAVFLRVVVPLCAPGLAAAWIYILALTFKDLSLAVMLSGIGNPLLSVRLFDLIQNGEDSAAAALGVLLTLLIALFSVGAQVLGRRVSVQQLE